MCYLNCTATNLSVIISEPVVVVSNPLEIQKFPLGILLATGGIFTFMVNKLNHYGHVMKMRDASRPPSRLGRGTSLQCLGSRCLGALLDCGCAHVSNNCWSLQPL